ncbi:MAG: tryptophan synthase subunit alpha [Candidatus Marinimicrobia bacterium]|nr:tryptophan synthase subunit alpha [Candidatus Neomarinimicrobiota bacterium]
MITYRERYKALKTKNEGALIPFTVLGDPDFKTSFEVIKTIIDNGADILELGMPFSDPIADGSTIQTADTRALENGIDIFKCMKLLKEIRKYSDIPIGLLMYSNLIMNYGLEEFYQKMDAMQINSVLVADMPLEESDEFVEIAHEHRVDTVFLVTPLTTKERLQEILGGCTGFVYLVARLGVTGARQDLQSSTLELIKRVRPQTDLPLNVGFGISEPEHVREVIKAGADGAIVGSALIRKIEKNLDNKEKMIKKIGDFVARMKDGTRA